MKVYCYVDAVAAAASTARATTVTKLSLYITASETLPLVPLAAVAANLVCCQSVTAVVTLAVAGSHSQYYCCCYFYYSSRTI
jgi:hypothetical protein